MIGGAISIRLESLGMPAREAIATAASLGFDGVEFDAIGPLSSKELSQTGRRELRHVLRSNGLSLTAIGFPTRHGYDHLDRLDARIEATAAAFALAFDLSCSAVVNHIGKIPDPADEAATKSFDEAMRKLANEADRVGSRLAIQTSLNTPASLQVLLDSIGSPSLGVNYAPAHLVMLGVDLRQGIEQLHSWILGVHVRDVIRGGIATTGVRDVPIGKGEIPWPSLFETLASIDYQRSITLIPSSADRTELTRDIQFVRSRMQL